MSTAVAEVVTERAWVYRGELHALDPTGAGAGLESALNLLVNGRRFECWNITEARWKECLANQFHPHGLTITKQMRREYFPNNPQPEWEAI